jgi:hypothetical protein
MTTPALQTTKHEISVFSPISKAHPILTFSAHHYGYGTGRRMCPGIHLAERNQWRIVAKLLWAFEFSELTDPITGKTIPLDIEAYGVGLLHSPLPFNINIKPRSAKHVEVIRREGKAALESLKQWE